MTYLRNNKKIYKKQENNKKELTQVEVRQNEMKNTVFRKSMKALEKESGISCQQDAKSMTWLHKGNTQNKKHKKWWKKLC